MDKPDILETSSGKTVECMEATVRPKKKIYIEVVRLVAIILVLYCHTSVNGLLYFQLGKGNRSSQLAVMVYPLAAGCVSLFFMISGALLLRKAESIGAVLRRRFSRFLLVTIVAVLAYYLLEGENLSVRGYLNALYSGGSLTQHWFLYAYLSFLLILPFLQRLVAGIPGNGFYWYLWGMGILFELVFPLFQLVSGYDPVGMSVPLLEQIVFYPLLGYFLDSKLLPQIREHRSRKWISLGVAAGFLLVLLAAYFMDRQSLAANGTLAYASWFAGLLFPGIYLLAGLLFDGIPQEHWLGRMLTFLGSGVFGTYLLEQFLRDRLFFLLEKWVYAIPEYFACWLWILVCALCGILITNLLKCIPLLKKFL